MGGRRAVHLDVRQVDEPTQVQDWPSLLPEPQDRRQPVQFDCQAELRFFISVKPSAHTRSSYAGSLRILEDWLARRSLAFPDVTPDLAAEFIRYVKDERIKDPSGRPKRRESNSVRSVVVACNCFYASLEKRFAQFRNPFRGVLKR